MTVTVFGATGGIGSHIVRQALDRGFTVTAVVRDAARLVVRDPALQVTTVSSTNDADAWAHAVRGSDAVVSGVGPRGRQDGPVASPSRGPTWPTPCSLQQATP